MAEDPTRGLLDTSVLVDLAAMVEDGGVALPDNADISSIALAELSAGPLLTDHPAERARRQQVLQRVQAAFDPLPFDDRCAAAYAGLVAATRSAGRSHRSRTADLLIAATALAYQLPLYTRNPHDVDHLTEILDVVGI
ncbi:MAG: PIN domain-containing protein [Egibacteraceae bacterium]